MKLLCLDYSYLDTLTFTTPRFSIVYLSGASKALVPAEIFIIPG